MKNPSKVVPSSSNPWSAQSEEEEEEQSSFSSSDEEESEIEREIADATFEEIQKAKSNGSLSVYGKPNREEKSGRANKNRPMEVSCKKPVPRFREVVQAPKKVVRDPRFESLSGELDVDGFRKRFDFLFEDNLPAEKEELKQQLKEANDQNVIDKLKKRILWINTQLKYKSTKKTEGAILSEHVRKEREAAKQGKEPFYLKKSEIRKQRLIKEYNKLKRSGKLESFIEKKRRKNASKDRRYMPYERSSTGEQQDQ
ncbi:rRNA biogenesis protein rrp36 [Euphorbia peplus]|nr:rRNA biogenesis protein rrp36 [Euphorbia peplus]